MSKSYNFAVQLPTSREDRFGFKKIAFVETMIKFFPWLTVAGIDSPFTINGKTIKGIDYAPAGTVLTFGTSKTHDVNWIENVNYLKDADRIPTYDLNTESIGALKHLQMFAESIKPKTPSKNNYYSTYSRCLLCSNLIDVEEFASCTKIGYNIIPKAIAFPIFCSYRKPQYITELTITIEDIFA
jgi:hypothetical protein